MVHWSKCPDGFRGTGTTCDTSACCRANFNADGALNSQDFFDFVAAFFDARPEADFNADGDIDPEDFFSYLTAFADGC